MNVGELSDAELQNLADQPTPPAEEGPWTLVSPTGRQWSAESPMRCILSELHDRVPSLVALARIEREMRDSEKHFS